MIKIIFYALFACFLLNSFSISAQEYDEEKTIAQLEKYIDNPKLYHDKIKLLTDQIKDAQSKNQKTIDEYERIMLQKDSMLKVYKSKSNKSTNTALIPTKPATTPTPTTAAAPKAVANTNSPYKVQLAAMQKDDIKKFLNTPKFLSFTSLTDRNVFEIAGFTDEKEAFEFAQYLRRTGVSGAFVSKYDNGVRDENYDYLRENNLVGTNYSKNNSNQNANKLSLDYPSTVPLGYQEIMSGKADINSTTVAASTAPASISTPASKTSPATTKKTTPISPSTNTPPSGTSKSQIDETFNKIFGR